MRRTASKQPSFDDLFAGRLDSFTQDGTRITHLIDCVTNPKDLEAQLKATLANSYDNLRGIRIEVLKASETILARILSDHTDLNNCVALIERLQILAGYPPQKSSPQFRLIGNLSSVVRAFAQCLEAPAVEKLASSENGGELLAQIATFLTQRAIELRHPCLAEDLARQNARHDDPQYVSRLAKGLDARLNEKSRKSP